MRKIWTLIRQLFCKHKTYSGKYYNLDLYRKLIAGEITIEDFSAAKQPTVLICNRCEKKWEY